MDWITALYLAAGVVEMLGEGMSLNWVVHIVKPLLMPILILYVFVRVGRPMPRLGWLLIGALICGMGGDTLLMFKGQLFFILGLGSFLIGHLFYITIYVKESKGHTVGMGYALVAGVSYILGFMGMLWPDLAEGLRIPVSIYAVVLCSMGLMAYKRYTHVKDVSFWMVMFGALLFIASDSMIAVSQFITKFPGYRFCIMSTYLVAQYLLVRGLVAGGLGKVESS